ncbi:substrate-binding domain-containing protein [Vulcanimicrobium alpinum]|nr:substrate-binding domain-containing protein [Vulcanimicrobium alpinum]
MKMLEFGVCRNAACPKAATSEPIELYPGPGEYCPDCGERLDPLPAPSAATSTAPAPSAPPPVPPPPAAVAPPPAAPAAPRPAAAVPAAPVVPPPAPAAPLPPPAAAAPPPPAPVPAAPVAPPRAASTSRVAFSQDDFEKFRAQVDEAPAAPPPTRAVFRPPIVAIAAAVVVVLLVVVVAVFGLRSRSGKSGSAAVAAAQLCGSPGTAELASAIAQAYAKKTGKPAPTVTTSDSNASPCDVRFWTAGGGDARAIIAHDAVVAIVNPQNPVSRLSPTQLRGILTGKITDWSSLGDTPKPIIAMLPESGSDEVRVVQQTLLRGVKNASTVVHAPSTAAVVRAVAGASGRRFIGLVSFSGAVPGKVLAIGASTPPSVLSIADHRYPYSYDVMVGSDFRTPPADAAALIAFARSDEVQAIVTHAGFIGRHGF